MHPQGLPMRHGLCAVSMAGLLTLTVGTAHAQGTFGMAGVLCSQYAKGAHSNDKKAARAPDMLHLQASQWLLGYISGMNAAMRMAKGTTPLSTYTSDQVLQSTVAYCEAHPDSNLA